MMLTIVPYFACLTSPKRATQMGNNKKLPQVLVRLISLKFFREIVEISCKISELCLKMPQGFFLVVVDLSELINESNPHCDKPSIMRLFDPFLRISKRFSIADC